MRAAAAAALARQEHAPAHSVTSTLRPLCPHPAPPVQTLIMRALLCLALLALLAAPALAGGKPGGKPGPKPGPKPQPPSPSRSPVQVRRGVQAA